MIRDPKNCGVCGRLIRPHFCHLYYDYGFPPDYGPNFVRDEWFNESVCQACGLNFFRWFKIHVYRTALPKFSFHDFRDNPEHVFMFWVVKMFRADIMICVNDGNIKYCENVINGINCRNRASEIEDEKHLCGVCYPLSPVLRAALRRENEERNIMESRRLADEIREDTIARIERWREKRKPVRKRREWWTFPWLSLPC